MTDFVQTSELLLLPKLWTSVEYVWHKFHNDFGIKEDWTSPSGYYGVRLDQDGNVWLWTRPGFQWDGASMYPDYVYMLFPSLVHDCLHWMIMHGLISTKYNDLIDKELGDCVRFGTTPIPWYKGGNLTRRFQAFKVERATHLCNQKREDRNEHKVTRVIV